MGDNPEITAEQWAKARPLAETRSDLVASMKRGRSNPRVSTKDLVSSRLDKDVLATLRASGSGWQSRANDMLRQGLGLEQGPDVQAQDVSIL